MVNERTSLHLESTATLLNLARDGDDTARDRLLARYLPILRRWARGRLPGYARDALDTDDLVQVTLMRALRRLDEFEPRREGAFLAYLRTILLNSVRDEIRRAVGRPWHEDVGERESGLADAGPSPVEEALGREKLEAYETALEALNPSQREAVILRLEMGFDHQQIAEAISSPSPDAARMVVARALVRLAEALRD